MFDRQHRSMDMVGSLSDAMDDLQPLSIATNYQQPSSYGAPRSSGPLSNPTATGSRFWNESRYDTDNLAGGLSLQQEFSQLKADYSANMEKLNQTMNSIKQFWSPELKRERQMRREEATRIAQLERMLAAAGGSAASVVGGNAALQMEIAARDDRIRQLTNMLDEQGPSTMMAANEIRYRELEQTVEHLQEMLKQAHAGNERLAHMEEELNRYRNLRAQQPRDFTDKTVTKHDIVTMKLKMERSEIELSERKQELAGCQARIRDLEDENMDLKSHMHVYRDNTSQRDHTNTILQGDVEALRKKLEAKNQTVEQRETTITRLEKELRESRHEALDRLENVTEIDRMKHRLTSHPDVVKEKEFNDKIEKLSEEKRLLERLVDDIRRTGDKERQLQLETYQKEVEQLKGTVDNLQKELTDRDILLESQNEKIGDLGREVQSAKDRLQAAMVDKGADELRKEVSHVF
ncbi:unnamed protein product, partial [Mesorhabditis spiculigera]